MELHPHLKRLHAALRDEEAAERRELVRLDALPHEEQVHAGHAWPTLRLAEVERAGRQHRALARAGRGVELHDGIGPGEAVWVELHGRRVAGTVEAVWPGAVELRLQGPPPPEGAQVVVRRRHDSTTFVRFRKALERADEHRSALRRVLLGESSPPPLRGEAELAGLDEAQRRAAFVALRAPDLAVIHGPPGTGKTRLLAKVLGALVAEGDRPWALADSNAAVDHLALRASAEGLEVVRIGPPARIGPELEQLALAARIRRSTLGPTLATLERDLVRAWGTAKGARLAKEHQQLLEQARQHVISSAQVIATTFGTLARLSDQLPPARTAVVDEATQATEAAIWAAVPHVERLVLVGDPHQLGPVSKVPGSPLERSVLERMVASGLELPMLQVQHRMVPPIRELVRSIYGPSYVDAELTAADAEPVLFVDTSGAGGERRDPATLSLYEPLEVGLVEVAVRDLRARGLQVGVITPYSAQVARIRARLPDVEVATVNAFQGREQDAIVVSLVRCNPEGDLGFVADGRRLTVALTRARRRLVLIGDAATLGRHPRFAELLATLGARGAVRSAWEEPWSEAMG